MSIIAILLCLFIEKNFPDFHRFRHFHWLRSSFAICLKNAKKYSIINSKIGALLLILPIPFLVALLDYQLYEFFIPLDLVFAIIVLFFSVGPDTFYDKSKSYIKAAKQNDSEAAKNCAQSLLNQKLDNQDLNKLNYLVTKSLLIISHERLFAVLLWFVLFAGILLLWITVGWI